MKNKTTASWLALIGGFFGLHWFYLRGFFYPAAWGHFLCSALGVWGIFLVVQNGLDYLPGWWLPPLLGLSVSVACLSSVIFGLQPPERWVRWFAGQSKELTGEAAGAGLSAAFLEANQWAITTRLSTVFCVIVALLLATATFFLALSYTLDRYFALFILAQGG